MVDGHELSVVCKRLSLCASYVKAIQGWREEAYSPSHPFFLFPAFIVECRGISEDAIHNGAYLPSNHCKLSNVPIPCTLVPRKSVQPYYLLLGLIHLELQNVFHTISK